MPVPILTKQTDAEAAARDAIERLDRVASGPKPNITKRGPSPTPPGATRDPNNPGITIAPPRNKRRDAKAARRKNRR